MQESPWEELLAFCIVVASVMGLGLVWVHAFGM